jgi:hypothetical protein
METLPEESMDEMVEWRTMKDKWEQDEYVAAYSSYNSPHQSHQWAGNEDVK